MSTCGGGEDVMSYLATCLWFAACCLLGVGIRLVFMAVRDGAKIRNAKEGAMYIAGSVLKALSNIW